MDEAQTPPSPKGRPIESGMLVENNGRTYRVKDVMDDLATVSATDIDTQRTTVLALAEIDFIPAAPGDTRRVPLDALTPDQDRIARERLAAIAPLLELPTYGAKDVKARATEVGRDTTTLYRWIRLYTATGDYTSLVPRKRGTAKGSKRIPAAAEDVIAEVIDTFYLNRLRPSAKKAVEEVQRQCDKRGIAAPSPGTIRTRISRLSDEVRLARRGEPGRARTRYRPVPGHFPGADYPLAVVQIDHTLGDVILVDDVDREPIGRPWLTIATDVYSRVITGYYLSFDAPSVTSVGMCITHSIIPKEDWLTRHGVPDAEWPVWGLPKTFHVDNGPDFRATDIQNACAANGVNITYRPLDRTSFGGHVERLIGNIMENLRGMPGYTASSIAERGEDDPEKHAAMTKSEFERWLLIWICKRYHQEKHRSILTSPMGRWKQAILGDATTPGAGVPKRPDAPDDLVRDFLPTFTRTVQKTGVAIERLQYYAEPLRPWIGRADPDNANRTRKLTFRRDPRDITTLWFFDPDAEEYYKIPLADRAIPSMSLWEYRRNRKKLASQGTAQPNPSQLVQAVDEMRQIEEDAQGRTKRAKRERRNRQRRDDHATALDPSAPIAPLPDAQGPPPTDDLTDEPVKPFPFD